MQLALQIIMGLSLSAVTGLRAFLPLLLLSIMSYNKVIVLNDKLSFLATKEAIIIFAIATISEIIADKVPAFDNFLDSLNTFIKPAAGVIIASSVITKISPLYALVLAIIVGGSISLSVNTLKAGTRLISTTTSLGVLNPFISIIEDILAFINSAAIIIFPIIGIFLIFITFIIIYLIYTKFAKSKKIKTTA